MVSFMDAIVATVTLMSGAKSGSSLRAGPVLPAFRCARRGLHRRRAWEADERPEPRSLGLLPSGPDPVGEWLVHRQPPAAYIGCGMGESKLGVKSAKPLWKRRYRPEPGPVCRRKKTTFVRRIANGRRLW